MTKYRVRLKNKEQIYTSNLSAAELLKRLSRLDTLRVLTEQHECKEGMSICQKSTKAFNKTDGFNGIIRLTFGEKDWLGYMLESEYIDDEDRECIEFYTRR